MKPTSQQKIPRPPLWADALLLAVALLGAPAWVRAQSSAPPASAAAVSGGSIHGLVKSGNMPIPGATITAMNTLTGQKAVSWTGVDGTYAVQVPANGRYVVRTQMAAFAPLTH